MKAHPFSIDIRRDTFTAGLFQWWIKKSGARFEGCPARYGSFEEARVTAKVRLDGVIADWRRTNAVT
ncbi:hypothetical protein [Methylobacterium trifolii]|uniref:Uncharacterized protein n=1 Tax=Methylobacterium trifolii TaxID=1003092 RepID=A0ABQ4TW91_9HYPH|nr:hypothetical protein [Methylobacterium trifolii]GJE59536.1 hypothetical protein MPOCJGCO_1631 [Methylobacterium trifolii]